jgi:hypothetical protein
LVCLKHGHLEVDTLGNTQVLCKPDDKMIIKKFNPCKITVCDDTVVKLVLNRK